MSCDAALRRVARALAKPARQRPWPRAPDESWSVTRGRGQDGACPMRGWAAARGPSAR